LLRVSSEAGLRTFKLMRKIDGWQTLAAKPIDQPIDLAA